MPNQSRPKPDERLALMGLNAIYESLDTYADPLEKRMEHVKRCRINLRVAKKFIQTAIEAVKETIDTPSLQYIVKNSEDYEIVVRQRRIIKDPSWIRCKTTDLEEVIAHAVADDCRTCVKNPQEAGACVLRKALKNMVDEPTNPYGCGFKGGRLVRHDRVEVQK